MARYRVPLKEGNLRFSAGPSFFSMRQKTEMYSFDAEPTREDPDNLDFSTTDEKVDANYYGFKIQTDFSLPLNKIFDHGGYNILDRFNIKSRLSLGGYLLNAKYEGQQHSELSYTNRREDNLADDDHSIMSYTSEAELGLQYDTGYGLISISGEGRYLSKTPFVKYVALGTLQPKESQVPDASYAPAHLNYTDGYSYGANIEFKILF